MYYSEKQTGQQYEMQVKKPSSNGTDETVCFLQRSMIVQKIV